MREPPPAALLLIADLAGQRRVVVSRTPFTIGRQPDSDLTLPFPYISRHHAVIVFEEGCFFLVDQGSRSGCFVNRQRVERHLLRDGDVIHFGSLQGTPIGFQSQEPTAAIPLRTLLGQMSKGQPSELSLSRLNWFVEVARRLNSLGGIHEILSALIEATLLLTGVERGYVFLRAAPGRLSLAAGLNNENEPLIDDGTISSTAIRKAIEEGREFIITDTHSQEAEPSHSMVAQSLRSIICIPLWKRSTERKKGAMDEADIMGALYLDSRKPRSQLTEIDKDMLHLIATEATTLVENAALAKIEEEGRRYREELKIASEIQQGLMKVRIPELNFSKVSARSLPCEDIGGDFYDAISVDESLYLVVADVSGKGVSAALLGSTLQGIVYAQVLARQPLAQIARFANSYLCHKELGKYATLVVLRLSSDGVVEYINCGHVQPLLHTLDEVQPLRNSNLPVGLVEEASYESDTLTMKPGERILIVTDGITEAETPAGDPYGDQRLRALLMTGAEIPAVLAEVESFTGSVPREDDCTIVEVHYSGCVA